MSDVRPGYKRTEAGVIPESWRVELLSRIGAPDRPAIKAGPFGSSLTKDTYVEAGYKIYGQEQVIAGDPFSGDYFIDRRKYMELASCQIRPGDILVSLVGTAGRVLVIPAGAPEGIINPRLVRLSPDTRRFSAAYLAHFLVGDLFQAALARGAQGGTMGVLNATTLASIPIAVPPLTEQMAIAEALQNADALIAAFDALIIKKRNIKQGAMQDLLTGERRLAGFSSQWAPVPIGDLYEFKNGLNKAKVFFGVGTPILNYMDVYRLSGVRTSDIDGRVTVTPDEIRAYGAQKGDVFFTRTSETQEEIGIAAVLLDDVQGCVFSGFVLRGRPKGARITNEFAQYAFASSKVRSQIIARSSYTTRALTNGRALSLVVLDLPSPEEQRAIAAALSDMDSEIVALEDKLTKARAMKRGMMQVLLTGEVRLI